jgi:Methyltransferase domain
MTLPESSVTATDLLNAAADAIPEDALVAVAGGLPDSGETGRRFVSFPAAARAGDLDSASAIVELERGRASGAGFLMLPAPRSAWLDELALFGEHCRSRYDVIFESAALGAVLDLRREAAARTGSLPATEAASIDEETARHEEGHDALDVLARSLSQLLMRGGFTADEFRTFERHGVHVTPVDFYGPIPDTAELSRQVWVPSELVGIDMNDDEQLRLLREVFPQFRNEYESLPTGPTGDDTAFHFGNGMFDGTDALVLYCMLRHLRPRRVIEVGSGYSTRLAAQAARANGSTELICIDPRPDESVREGYAGITSVITERVEEVPLDLFTGLGADDILFIDSSHAVRTGGDVAFLYLEVLPRLQPGVVLQVHDIFLPHQYPREWMFQQLRFWNEQYLLQAFLSFNSDFRVLLANSYVETRHPGVLQEAFPKAPWWGGGSLWMQRKRSR